MKSNVETIPSGWKYKRLDDVFILARGGSPRPINDFLTEDVDGFNWIKIGDTKNIDKYIFSTEQKIKKEGLSKTQLVKEDDFILSNSMSFGRPYIMKTEGCIHDGWLLLRKKNKDLSIDFMYYLLSSEIIRSQFKNKAAGSTVLNLNIKLVASVKALIPTYTEQQKIAEILSTVDEKIEAIAQRIAETQALKKGLMQQLLTKGIGHTKFKDSSLGEIPESWEVVELGTLLEKIVGGGTPSKEIPAYWNGNISWGTVKDLKSYIIEETIDSISEDGLKNSAANLIPAWTLVTSTRMALGKAVFFTKDVAINQDLKALYPKKELDKFFLFHWFFSNSEYILSLGSGSTVKGIRLEVLRGLKIALPNLSEQQKIAEILSSVDEKLQIQQDKKAEYQELKKGLMQQLLTGKIRVSLPQT